MPEEQPPTITKEEPTPMAIQEPAWPIQLTKTGPNVGILCRCGNNNMNNFMKFHKQCLAFDSRKRAKYWKELHLICMNKRCNESVPYNVFMKMYQDMTMPAPVTKQEDKPQN